MVMTYFAPPLKWVALGGVAKNRLSTGRFKDGQKNDKYRKLTQKSTFFDFCVSFLLPMEKHLI